jgi:hypothetical protein
MKCPPDLVPPATCGFINRGSCSNNATQELAICLLCRIPDAYYSVIAVDAQYQLDGNVIAHNCQFAETSNVAVLVQISLCHFDGHSADNLQLLLTPNASARVDSMNRRDERV